MSLKKCKKILNLFILGINLHILVITFEYLWSSYLTSKTYLYLITIFDTNFDSKCFIFYYSWTLTDVLTDS